MNVYLVDGTYELFRHFYAVPSRRNAAGREIAATRGVVGSLLMMLESGNTHIGVATDHVVESFRNTLYPGYKSSAGMDPEILQQFPLLEEALSAFGFTVWPMVEFEADDGLAAAARTAAADPEVDMVYICSPDKDLSQCVIDGRIAILDRRKNAVMDENGVMEKFGVPPVAIPDYLALVGDSSDGYPGLPGWGPRAAATLLQRYTCIEEIPDDATAWDVTIRGAERLAATLAAQRDNAMLYKDLATLRYEPPLFASVEELRWRGPAVNVEAVAAEIEGDSLLERARALAARLAD